MDTKKVAPVVDVIMLLIACLTSLVLIKIPALIHLKELEYDFYLKNAPMIVFFGMSVYVLLTKRLLHKIHWLWILLAFTIPAVFINLLPVTDKNDSVMLSCLHLALLMWCIYGMIYIGMDTKTEKRMAYIRYNGDLIVLTSIILSAGSVFSMITIGLFGLLGMEIQEFYFKIIGVWGLVSAPIVATYIIKNHGIIANKIAPIIANIFSPLVLIMLVIFLISFPFSQKDPYNDRDFLLVFNILLLGVMALIVFAVSESSKIRKQQFNKVVLTLMAIAALIINMIALSAILYRLGEYGFTPNRTAVLVSNLLLFGNLIWITIRLFKVTFNKKDIVLVEDTISKFLPIYAAWTIIVVFA
ncbi:MAG: DUF4173 domain-containing protein [Bacteroidia bacterium]|nr:DUF4173 domain-containing protein [Bacteroidia bacterium]